MLGILSGCYSFDLRVSACEVLRFEGQLGSIKTLFKESLHPNPYLRVVGVLDKVRSWVVAAAVAEKPPASALPVCSKVYSVAGCDDLG